MMSVETALRRVSDKLAGSTFSPNEKSLLVGGLPSITGAQWLLNAIGSYRLAGELFSLSEELDESGMGVEMRWMTAKEMLDEANGAYPGIIAKDFGYIPIGVCLEGSGDPYFININMGRDPAIVRIPHGASTGGSLELESIEIVAGRLSDFLTRADIRGRS